MTGVPGRLAVTCVCGRSFEAKRKTARYCSDRCRQRAHRHPAAAALSDVAQEQPPPLTLSAVPDDDATPASPPRRQAAWLTEATRDELGTRATTALGMAALALAAAIESPLETASGRAALVREFRATLAAALAGAEPARSPLDELKARRDAKRGVRTTRGPSS